MTFACPNRDDDGRCRMLDTLCVPGRPGCVQEGTATFALDVETRIRMAEEQAALLEAKKKSALRRR